MTQYDTEALRGLVNMHLAQLAAAAVVPAVVIYDLEGGNRKAARA